MQLEPFGGQPVAEVELLKVGHLVALFDDEVLKKWADLQHKMLTPCGCGLQSGIVVQLAYAKLTIEAEALHLKARCDKREFET